MTITPQPPAQAPTRTQLVRDLTLTSEAPMAFCVRLLLQRLHWSGRQERLFELFSSDPRGMDIVDARNLMLRLGYTSSQEILQSWHQLEVHNLPALYLDSDQRAYVLLNNGDESIFAANANGRVELINVSEGGSLVLFKEAPSADRNALLQKLLYRFRNRLALLYGISFVMALLALVVPFYIRAMYNVVIPSESGLTGTGLYIGVILLFLLDWTLRQWRSSQLSSLAARLDALLGLRLVEKTLELDSNQVSVLGPRNFQNQQRNLDALPSVARAIQDLLDVVGQVGRIELGLVLVLVVRSACA